MSPPKPDNRTLQESWASAFVDGEADCCEPTGWSETVQEQLYYYTLTRQVLRGQIMGGRGAGYQTERTTWIAFWARVDAD
jgi:hypothetical protein